MRLLYRLPVGSRNLDYANWTLDFTNSHEAKKSGRVSSIGNDSSERLRSLNAQGLDRQASRSKPSPETMTDGRLGDPSLPAEIERRSR
jgi:hypothetical protein